MQLPPPPVAPGLPLHSISTSSCGLATGSVFKSTWRMTLNIDLAPTCLDLAGLRPPKAMQGQSLVPLLQGKPHGWREEFFYEHYTRRDIIPPSEGIRNGRWKYLRWMNVAPPVEELYDLASDPGEKHNLAGDLQHAGPLAT